MNNYRWKRAIGAYRNALAVDPSNEFILTNLGMLLDHRAIHQKKRRLRMHDEHMAMRYYKKALYINPRSLNALWGLGRIYWHRKNQRALIYYRRALAINPPNREAMINLANAYQTLGNTKRAFYWYRRAYAMKKDFTVTYLLATWYVERRQLNKARRMAEEALIYWKRQKREVQKTKSWRGFKKRLEAILSFLIK